MELYDFCCTPCSNDGHPGEAINQCLDCNEFYCGKCIILHPKIASTSSHKVLSQREMRDLASQEMVFTPNQPSRNCQAHGGERITTYCSDHGVVCCNTGVATSHKNCDGIRYIADAANDIKVDQQLQPTKSSISTVLKEMKGEMDSRDEDIATLEKDKATAVQQVTDFTERQIKRLRELEKAALEEINLKHNKLSADAGRDLAGLSNGISILETDLQRLDGYHGNNEPLILVDVKLGQSHEAESRNLLQNLENSSEQNLKFILKTNMDNFLKDLDSIGSLVDDNRVYKAKLRGEYSVNMNQDTTTCDLQGCCQLPDGTVLVADYGNGSLKRLDSSYSVIDHLVICDSCMLWGVTCVAPDEVAVTTVTEKKVIFVALNDTMSTTRAFGTKGCCRGICYTGGHLYVSCGGLAEGDYKEGPGHVALYTLQGVHVRNVQTDPSGRQMFSQPLHICAAYNITSDNDCVLVSDWDDDVMLLNLDGTLVGSITDLSLYAASGLCLLDNGHFLVCGYISHNVLQFSCDGKKINELLTEADSIKYPRALCYDSRNNRLIITMGESGCMKVFDLLEEHKPVQ